MKNSTMYPHSILFIAVFSFATLSKKPVRALSAAVLKEARQVFFANVFSKRWNKNIPNRKSTPLNLKCKGQSDLGYSTLSKILLKNAMRKTKSGIVLGAMAANENKSNQKTQSTSFDWRF